MQLIRLREVPSGRNDRVYCYSRTHATIAYGLWFGGCVALVVAGARQHAYVLEFAAALLGMGLLLARRFLIARFRDSNWLLRADENGLYVQFRSYLNYHFSPDDQSVAFIPYRDIRVARAVRERRELPELSRNDRAVSIQTLQLAELELGCDTTSLRAALNAERARPAPREATWYGTSGVKFQHYPVALDDGARLRLTWECVPSVRVFLEDIRRYVQVGENTSTTKSFSNLSSSSHADQEEQIAGLARVGQLVYAIAIARRLYGYDLRQARAYVESLMAREQRSA